MNIGFIGTGAITEAMVIGLYQHGNYQDVIMVSRRSETRSQKLATLFAQVEVVDDNQEIVDRCDSIVAAVLPEQTPDVLSQLNFSSDQTIISVAAGIPVAELAQLVAPATEICRAIPMPPIEHGLGPTPVYPPHKAVETLFNSIGNAVSVKDESLFSALAAGGCVMASFFELEASVARWLQSKGIPENEAAVFMTSIFHALASLATKTDAKGLQNLSNECQTVGGLNEQVINGCLDAGWFEIMQAQLEGVLARLENTK